MLGYRPSVSEETRQHGGGSRARVGVADGVVLVSVSVCVCDASCRRLGSQYGVLVGHSVGALLPLDAVHPTVTALSLHSLRVLCTGGGMHMGTGQSRCVFCTASFEGGGDCIGK